LAKRVTDLEQQVTAIERREKEREDRRRRWLAKVKQALMMLVAYIEKGEA
jgi:hypothetical protein